MKKETLSNIIGLSSIALSLILAIEEKYRILAVAITVGVIIFYLIEGISRDVETWARKTKRLEEKLKIHEQLIEMKADISYLKNEVSKRK